MTDQTPQDPQERLAAVDPAASAPDPDIAAMRAKVLAQPQTNVVPLRRRRTVYVVGAVAAGICLLAGTAVAGAAVGRVTAPSTDAVTAAPPVAVDSLPVIGAAPNSPQMASVGPQGAAGAQAAAPLGAPEAMSSQPADAKMSIWPGWGSSFIPDPSLPNEAGTATGYRLVSDGIDARALAAQLAKAFGIKGEPREEYGSLIVGPNDGSGPSIWVYNDPMVSWSYSDPTKNPWNCGVTPMPEPAPAESGETEPVAPDVAECTPTEESMSEQDAVRAARKILAAVGVSEDPAAGIDVEWEAGTDGFTTWATAWQRVDGNRTQLSWTFTFDDKDPLWANGFAAGLEPVPAYPIVGAYTAVERSQDPRFTSFGPTPLDFGGVVPMAAARGTETSDATASSEPATSPTIPPGDPGKVQVWWDPITVTGAELTLAQYWQPDGTLLILPAYRLTTADDRGTWAVIAVADSAIQWINPAAQQ